MQSKSIKEYVREGLEGYAMPELYSETEIKYYHRKLLRDGCTGGNRYVVAMRIVDMIILNAPAPVR